MESEACDPAGEVIFWLFHALRGCEDPAKLSQTRSISTKNWLGRARRRTIILWGVWVCTHCLAEDFARTGMLTQASFLLGNVSPGAED